MISGFTIKLDTSRTGAVDKLNAVKAGPDSKNKDGKVLVEADQTQCNAVKSFIESRINALPEQFDGVLVIADGTQDLETGRSICTIQIYGKTGHL